MKRNPAIGVLAAALLVALSFSARSDEVPAGGVAVPQPARNAYFGELHIHSSWSIDSYVFGTHIGPDEATRYAKGESVLHPGGFEVKLAEPLDFITQFGMSLSVYNSDIVFAAHGFSSEANALRIRSLCMRRISMFTLALVSSSK
jgi:hypothetical protein